MLNNPRGSLQAAESVGGIGCRPKVGCRGRVVLFWDPSRNPPGRSLIVASLRETPGSHPNTTNPMTGDMLGELTRSFSHVFSDS